MVQSTIHISSVIRQKGESQNGCFKKNKARQFSGKRTFLNPCAYQGVRNVRFLDNLACSVFVETSVLRFTLLPYYRRFVVLSKVNRKTSLISCKTLNLRLLLFQSHRIIFRSNHRRCSIKKTVLKNFAIFTGKHLWWILFLVQLEVNTGVFYEYCESFKKNYFAERLWAAASQFCWHFL